MAERERERAEGFGEIILEVFISFYFGRESDLKLKMNSQLIKIVNSRGTMLVGQNQIRSKSQPFD